MKTEQLVKSTRNANGQVVAQKINRRLLKFDSLKYPLLTRKQVVWLKQKVANFSVRVTYYDDELDKVVSRLNMERKVDSLLSPNELLSNKYNLDNLDKISCILVDEAQFLKQEQVKELWAITKIYNIPVNYEPNETIDREYCGKNADTLKRFELLKENIEKVKKMIQEAKCR